MIFDSNRRRTALALVAIVLVVGLIAPAAAGNSSNSTATTTATNASDDSNSIVPDVDLPDLPSDESSGDDEPDVDRTKIDDSLGVVNATYDEDSGMARVVLWSGIPQRVVLTDAGGVLEGGQIDRRRTTLSPGETAIEIPATRTQSGRVVVSIGSEESLYALPIEAGAPPMFEGDPTWETARIAGASGFAGGLLIVALIAWRRARGGREEVTRVV